MGILSVRIDKELERLLEQAAMARGITKSALVKLCLQKYASEHVVQATPYELWDKYRPTKGSGRKDQSVNHSTIVKEKLREKRRR